MLSEATTFLTTAVTARQALVSAQQLSVLSWSLQLRYTYFLEQSGELASSWNQYGSSIYSWKKKKKENTVCQLTYCMCSWDLEEEESARVRKSELTREPNDVGPLATTCLFWTNQPPRLLSMTHTDIQNFSPTNANKKKRLSWIYTVLFTPQSHQPKSASEHDPNVNCHNLLICIFTYFHFIIHMEYPLVYYLEYVCIPQCLTIRYVAPLWNFWLCPR